MLGVVWWVQRRVTRGSTDAAPARSSVGGARRAAKERPRDVVRVVAKRSVGAKAQVVVVEVDGIRYLLGVGDSGVSVLDSRPVEEESLALAPLTPLPLAPVHALPSAAPATADTPLPLRRTLRATERDAQRAARPTFTAALSREASQALRRALGA